MIGCDQTVVLSRKVARHDYPAPLRRLRVRDPKSEESIALITIHFALTAATISALDEPIWQT